MFKPKLSYANVTATLALVFSMTGGAMAAHHYLITSTKQISPKVVKALKGKNGKTGPTGPAGAAGKEGAKGERGELGPSRSFQDRRASLTIPEPGGGLGTAIDSLTLPGGTYLVTATGTISRTGLSAGQGATQDVQLRRGAVGSELTSDELLESIDIECEQGSTGGSHATYSVTRLVVVTGTSQRIDLNAFDVTSAGTKSTAEKAALTATQVTEGTGAQ